MHNVGDRFKQESLHPSHNDKFLLRDGKNHGSDEANGSTT